MRHRTKSPTRRNHLYWKDLFLFGLLSIWLLTAPAWAAPTSQRVRAEEKKVFSIVPPPLPFARLSAQRKQKLLQGKIPVRVRRSKNKKGQTVAVATAWIVIPRPPKKIYTLLTRFAERRLYMPRMTHSRVVRRWSPREVYVYQQLRFLWVKVPLHLKMILTPGRRITWRLLKSKKNGVKENMGYWHFEGIKGGQKTLITYSLFTDSGRAVPAFIQNMMIKSDLPGVLRNVRKRVLSHGRWKK